MAEMEEKCFEFVWKNKNERNEALARISNFSEFIVEMAEDGGYICEPLDERGYQLCVYNFLRLLPSMSMEDLSKYKKFILEERWELKTKRSDELIDIGVGRREQISIGISAEAANYIFDDYFWQECEDFIFNDLESYSDEPVLIVKRSQRVEHIEKVLDERNVTLGDVEVSVEPICLSALLERRDITDTVSLIEDTKKLLNCSVCEAVVESAFVVLETWCQKESK